MFAQRSPVYHVVMLIILVVAMAFMTSSFGSCAYQIRWLQRQGHRKVRRFRHHRGNRVRDVSGSDEESEDDSDDDSDWEESDEESESEMEGYDLDTVSYTHLTLPTRFAV